MAGFLRPRLNVSSSQRNTNTSAWPWRHFPCEPPENQDCCLKPSETLDSKLSGKWALGVWLFLPFSLALFLVFFPCFAQYQGFHAASCLSYRTPTGSQMNKDSSLSTLVGPRALTYIPLAPRQHQNLRPNCLEDKYL